MVEFVLKYGNWSFVQMQTGKRFVLHKRRQFSSSRADQVCIKLVLDQTIIVGLHLPARTTDVPCGIKWMTTTPDVSFHPLIYNLTINLSNNRLMGGMVEPAGFKQSGQSPETPVAQQSD